MKNETFHVRVKGWTICKQGEILKIGRNFADAVSGKLTCVGDVSVGSKSYSWVSTLDCMSSEHVLRLSATKEGKSITYLRSQGV